VYFDTYSVRSRKSAIITGNPGIGKSRSMNYFLKLLLEKQKTVVYEVRKERTVYAFIPQEKGEYTVWRCSLPWNPNSCPILDNSDNYYLIDPSTAEQIVEVASNTVLVASDLNEKIYKEVAKGGSLKWIMPIWKKGELKALQSVPLAS
jgi:hypothetical protein